MSKFTNHYSEEQQIQVKLINEEIEFYALGPQDYCLGYDLNQVNAVLTGKSPINPKKLLSVLWTHFFGDFDPNEFSSESGFADCYNPNDKVLVARIKKRMTDEDIANQGVNSTYIAKKINKSPSTVSQLLSGKYAASPTKYLHDIYAIVAPAGTDAADDNAHDDRPVINIRYGEVPFVPTSVAKVISLACEHARARRRFSVVAGQAGIGKSRGLERYCEENPLAILIIGSEQTTSKQVIESLCTTLGLPKKSSVAKNIENIVRTIENTERIILLDEADKCKPSALDPLRTISDAAKVGVCLIGNIQLVDKLQTNERYELISSRVCFWPKPIGEVPIEDIRNLFNELTQGTVPLESDDDQWWQWLHKRVEGNSRLLVENLLPHILSHSRKNPNKKLDKLLVNSIFANVLNQQAV
ncbi:hypothetical protein JL49_17100 [Pseudoalteromonas luteoviolacea]|nr:hypothetical protein JL49_17100 [Pseudoalteromonas luteoviolacea]